MIQFLLKIILLMITIECAFAQSSGGIKGDIDELNKMYTGAFKKEDINKFYSIVKKYTINSSAMEKESLVNLVAKNPFLSKIADRFKSIDVNWDGKTDSITENIKLGYKLSLENNTKDGSISAITGVGVEQRIIMGMTKFIEKRVEQELFIVGLEKLKDELNKMNPLIFTNTSNYLNIAFMDNGINVSLPMLRSTVQQDLVKLSSNYDSLIPLIIEISKINNSKEIINHLRNSEIAFKTVIEHQQLSSSIGQWFDKISYSSTDKQSVLLTMYSLLNEEENNIKEILTKGDSSKYECLMGLLLQLCIHSKVLLDDRREILVSEYLNNVDTKEKRLSDMTLSLKNTIILLDNAIQAIGIPKREDIELELNSPWQYWGAKRYKVITEVYCILFDSKYMFVEPNIRNSLSGLECAIMKKAEMMHLSISEKQYSMFVAQLMSILHEVSDKKNNEDVKVISKNSTIKVMAILAAMAEANSTEELEAAVLNSISPPGSYRTKRSIATDLSINAYGGITVVSEASSRTLPALGFGVSTPVGVAYSWTCRNSHSYSIFVTALDFGLPLYARIASRDKNEWKTSLRIVDLIAPGISVFYNYPQLPFSAGFTVSYLPNLRSIPNGLSNTTSEMYRVGMDILVDIPLFSIYSDWN